MSRLEQRKGALKAGLDADLVVCSEDPTKDLAVLRRPMLVINGGKVTLNSIRFPAKAQIQTDQEKIPSQFAASLKAKAADSDPFAAYEAKLQKDRPSVTKFRSSSR